MSKGTTKSSEKKRIFIVDDEPKIGELFVIVLRRDGFDAHSFTSAIDLLEYIEQEGVPDLIIADLVMPDMDGIELIEALRQRKLTVPVIIMTAHSSVLTAIEAMRLGAFNYLQKPVHLEEMRVLIDRALELKVVSTGRTKSSKGKRIFIVDDEPKIGELFASVLLRDYGFYARSFTNPKAFLEHIDQGETPDVILADLMMPGMDGIELIEALRQRKLTVPVIIMTAHSSVKTAVEAMKLGAFHYLEKPVNLEEMHFLINRALQLKTEKTQNNVFISYCRADSEFLKRLLIHLKPLEREGLIDLWSDKNIKVGDKWEEKLQEALATAKVAILLISADFLASDFIANNELPPLLSAAEERGTTIIPLIIKPSRFTRDRNLRAFQALNDPSRPLIKMSEVEREETYAKLAEMIEQL